MTGEVRSRVRKDVGAAKSPHGSAALSKVHFRVRLALNLNQMIIQVIVDILEKLKRVNDKYRRWDLNPHGCYPTGF